MGWASSMRQRTIKLGRHVALKFLPDELAKRSPSSEPLPAGMGKAGNVRTIPLPAWVKNVLDQRLRAARVSHYSRRLR